MLGIPLELEIEGQRERIFFATRRTGEAGGKMRELRRAFHAAKMACALLMQRMAMLEKRAESETATEQDLEGILKEQFELGQQLLDKKEAWRAAADELVRLSLGENYPEAALVDRIMGCLTDQQVAYLVTVLETGEMPEGFFPQRAIPPSGNITSPSGGGTGASS